MSSCALVALLSGCGGAAGEAVRPKDLTGKDALPGAKVTCSAEPKYAKPLIVDLDADARVELEATMKKGVVVVAYDCNSLRILKSCKVPGPSYEYAGVSRREDVVHIKDQDQLSVNLPLSSAKLGADVSSGRSIDLAIVLVGLQSTTLTKIDRAKLDADCEGATHFVQSASVGAFAMGTASAGSVKVAADLFKTVGAKGSSDASRGHDSSDGSLDSCRSSNPDNGTPPGECRAPLRIELIPIPLGKPPAPTATDAPPGAAPETPPATAAAAPATKDPGAAPPPAQKNPCPDGYGITDGICKKAVAASTHVCQPHDLEDCKAQCSGGSNESCYNASLDRSLPPAEKTAFAKKGCDANIAESCGVAAWSLHMEGSAKREDETSPRNVEAVALGQKGCDAGAGRTCWILGGLLDRGNAKSVEAANRAFTRSCKLGDSLGCEYIASRYANGTGGLKADPAMAVDLASHACPSPDSAGCTGFATLLYSDELGPRQDKIRAAKVLSDYCAAQPGLLCMVAAGTAENAKDDDSAFKLMSVACDHDGGACGPLADMYVAGTGVKKDLPKARAMYKKACEATDSTEYCKKAKGGSLAPKKKKASGPFG